MNKATLSHLFPLARRQAALGDDERIKGLLRGRWIDYPRATQELQQLERLYETPRRERMPCMLLHGRLKQRKDEDHRKVPPHSS
jgi:hypothetical protein